MSDFDLKFKPKKYRGDHSTLKLFDQSLIILVIRYNF